MEVIRIDLENTNLPKIANSVFVIGRFQTLHKGHQSLFLEAKQRFPNKQIGVMTFYPDPRDFFTGKQQKKILTYDERLKALEDLGVEIVVEFNFTSYFANLSREEFVNYVTAMGIDTILHGSDFRFGKQGEDEVEIQSTLFHEINDYQISDTKVSSSLLADDLQKGDIETVNLLLGYNYFLNGNVIRGDQIARTLGFPTANISTDSEKLLPGDGVYATKTEIDGKSYYSLTHVGPSPTLGREMICVESHLLSYCGDLYEKDVKVTFFQKIRNVQKFANISEIKAQISRDITEIQRYFNI